MESEICRNCNLLNVSHLHLEIYYFLVGPFVLYWAYARINIFNIFIQLMMDFATTNFWCEKWNLIIFVKEINNIVIDLHYYHKVTWNIICLLDLYTKRKAEKFAELFSISIWQIIVQQRSYWRRRGEYIQRRVCFVNI